jgi:hypothetical protein
VVSNWCHRISSNWGDRRPVGKAPAVFQAVAPLLNARFGSYPAPSSRPNWPFIRGIPVKLPAAVIVRDVEPKDRPRWEPLWQGYQTFRTLPEEITEMTWRRFFDGLGPVHALVAEEGEALIGFAHYLFHRSTAQMGSVCYLQDMFTVEAARGRGLAGP